MRTIMLFSFLAISAIATFAQSAVAPADCVAELSLTDAMPGGKPMLLHMDIRDGAIKAAIAHAPAYNRMPYAVDFTALKLAGDKFAGSLKVTIFSDGFVPKEDKRAAEFALDTTLADGRIIGTFTGTCGTSPIKGQIAGHYAARPAKPVPARLLLDCQNVIQVNPLKAFDRRSTVEVGIDADGKCIGAKYETANILTDSCSSGRLTAFEGSVVDGRFKLTLTTSVELSGKEGTTCSFQYAIDAPMIGSTVAGPVKVIRNGKAVADGAVVGHILPIPPVGKCIPTLTLHDLVGPMSYLKLFTVTSQGAFVGGFGAAPAFNAATHEVDLTNLKIDDKRVDGTIKVALLPDPWVPKDHKPIACELRLSGAVTGGEITGAYEGKVGDKAVKGDFDGGLTPLPELGAMTGISFKFENGLIGGSPTANRCFINATVENGRLTGGTVGNNHTSLKGTVKGGEVTLEHGSLRGTLEIDVTAGSGAETGRYTFKVDGVCVGDLGAGNFQTFRDAATPAKTGRFKMSVRSKTAETTARSVPTP